jgi:lipopolysaccharide transport system permease protein
MRDTAQTISIQAGESNRISLKELWHYRELFYFFAWRDIKVRYKQTFIGVAWAIIQPVLATGVFVIIFNLVAGIRSADIPYPILAYLGMLYWNVFSGSLNTVANSLLNNQGVLTKIYFPRLIPPLSALAVSVVDFLFASTFFVVILIIYKLVPAPEFFIAAPAGLVMIALAALGAGTFFAALNVKYRDVRAALPFLTQIVFFMTPVIYPLSLVPERFHNWVYLNPMAGAINLVRGSLYGEPVNWTGLALSWTVIAISLAFGLWYFKRVEKAFVDII